MTVTLKEIAEHVGVSKQVVSAVLKGTTASRVSAEKRKSILEAVKQLDYRPNYLARALVEKKTWTIGFAVGDICLRYQACQAQALMNEAEKHGYQLMISLTNYDQEKESKCLENMIARRVDGVIYNFYLSPESSTYKRLVKSNYPILMAPHSKHDFNAVGYDDAPAFEDAVKMFKSRGHQRIVILCGPYDYDYNLFEAAAQKHGMAVEPVIFGPEPQLHAESFAQILEKRPSAVFCTPSTMIRNMLDYLAVRAPDYRPECVYGFSLPEQEPLLNEAIVGVICHSFRAWVETTIARLIQIIENPSGERRDVLLPSSFMNPKQFEVFFREEVAKPYYIRFK